MSFAIVSHLDNLYVDQRAGPDEQAVDDGADDGHQHDQRLVPGEIGDEEDDGQVGQVAVDGDGVDLLLHHLLGQVPPGPGQVLVDERLRRPDLLEEPEQAEQQGHLQPTLHFRAD